ncbi:outer membrane beta-barrel protein [Chryseobacterium sp. RRHN12]|uniref:outer membrane beta-barrel protein n=1 Tax=Chryseobacterium sp. RRHN12 TaxID=3437884 RepID=UPI003D9ABB47
MNKKKIRILCVLLFSTGYTALSAQKKFKIGLEQAVTYTSMEANLASSNLSYSKYSPRMGVGVNFSAEYLFWRSFFIASGVSHVQKNYRFERTGKQKGWYTNFNNSFITVPVLLGAYIIRNPYKQEGVWTRLAAGMYREYWSSMRREGRYPNIGMLLPDNSYTYIRVQEEYDFRKNENQLRRFGFGLQAQAQAGYAFKNIDIYGSCNYQHGISDMNSIEETPQKMSTRSYIFSVGAAYKF